MMEDGKWRLVKSVVTNADGRTDKPILPGDEAKVGQYELVFHVTDYLKARSGTAEAYIFIDDPVVRFAIFERRGTTSSLPSGRRRCSIVPTEPGFPPSHQRR